MNRNFKYIKTAVFVVRSKFVLLILEYIHPWMDGWMDGWSFQNVAQTITKIVLLFLELSYGMICLQVLKMKVPLKGLCVNWTPTLLGQAMPQSNFILDLYRKPNFMFQVGR